MVARSITRVSQRDKEKFLTLFSPVTLRITAGIVSGLVIFLVIYGLLLISLPKIIKFDARFFVAHLVFSALVGLVSAYLKHVEHKLEMVSYKETTIYDILPNFLYPFYLALTVLYILFYAFIQLRLETVKDISSVIVLSLVVSAFIAYTLMALWNWIYSIILEITSPVDWRAKMDEDNFYKILTMKFYESKRYLIPLTLGLIELKNFDELATKIGLKKLSRLLDELLQKIIENLRFIDIVARIDEGRRIGILLGVPSASAKVPLERVRFVIEEFAKAKGIELRYSMKMVAFEPEMITEMDMLKAQGEILADV